MTLGDSSAEAAIQDNQSNGHLSQDENVQSMSEQQQQSSKNASEIESTQEEVHTLEKSEANSSTESKIESVASEMQDADMGKTEEHHTTQAKDSSPQQDQHAESSQNAENFKSDNCDAVKSSSTTEIQQVDSSSAIHSLTTTTYSPLLRQLLQALQSPEPDTDLSTLLEQIDSKLSTPPPPEQSQSLHQQIQSLTEDLEAQRERYDQYSKKVDQWKASVKQISKKDLAKINALKKNVQQLNEQMEGLRNQNTTLQQTQEKLWTQRFVPLNDHFDVVQRVQETGDDVIWTLISYDDKSMGYQWIEDKNISEDKIKREVALPPTTQQQMHKNFDEKLHTLRSELEESQKRATESDEALQHYKSRAHQALKKKAESLNVIKLTHEKEISELEEQVSELTQTVHDLQQSNKDLNDNVTSLLRMQEEHVSLKSMFSEQKRALQELQHSCDLQQMKMRNLEQETEKQSSTLQKREQELIEHHTQELKSLKQENQRLDDDLVRVKEKHRREINEKDSKITLFQQTCSELKQKIESITNTQAVTSQALPTQEEKQHAASPSSHAKASSKRKKSSHQKHHTPNYHHSHTNGSSTKDEQELKVFRSIVGNDLVHPQNGDEISNMKEANVESGESQTSARVLQLAEKFADRDAELQDKIQFINILKESLALKTAEVAQLKETEKQLREQITNIQQLQKKGAPNVEYLKNVFLKYVHTEDETVRSHAVRALGQLLSLPKDEVKRLEDAKKQKSSWF
mmetsp:Transcript_283/g.978  ORF Transcript_283/g.978 Transcript_283/m.978 type:complete len:744 (-) Transcript_283:787-3018(-)